MHQRVGTYDGGDRGRRFTTQTINNYVRLCLWIRTDGIRDQFQSTLRETLTNAWLNVVRDLNDKLIRGSGDSANAGILEICLNSVLGGAVLAGCLNKLSTLICRFKILLVLLTILSMWLNLERAIFTMGVVRAIVDRLGALGNRNYPLGFSKSYLEKIEGYCRKLSLELGHHSQDDFTMVGSVVPENWVSSFAGGGVRQIEPLPAYDVHLEHGSVHKYQSTVMDSNGTILMDLSDSLKPSASKWNTSDHLFNIRKDAVRLHRWEGELVVVSSPYCNNYYHWLFDSLPRLESGVCQRASKLYVHQYRSFQRESMEILGISDERIVVADKHPHLRADLLLIPSLPFPPLPAPPSVWRLPVVSRHACGYLREELAARALRVPNEPRRDTSTEKIFIQRSGARGIENENEVWSLLSIEGFQRVALENLSLSEQIRLFGRAETVVGVHGAGLTNIVFCRPGTRVVELMPTAWAMPCYWSISRHVGLDYHRVDVASVAPDGELATAASRVSVDLELFKAALNA